MPYLGRTVVTNLADFHVDNYAAGGGFTAGSTTQLTLTVAGIDDEEALSIFFDGVHQHHNTFTIASSVVTFDTAIPTGTANVEIHYGKQPVASALAANSVDGSHIAMGSDAAGDIIYYNGTDYVRLAKGTSGHFLKIGASAPAWAGVGILLQVVEMAIAQTSGTSTIPFDDTVPASGEGTEIGSQAITMADDSNKVLIEGQIQFGVDTSAIGVIVAVFRGTTNVGTYDHDQTDSQTQTNSIPIHILDSPATAGSVTYSLRIGAQGSATWRLNFGTSGDNYGGSRKSTIFLKELSA
jgi:hypothetical protein